MSDPLKETPECELNRDSLPRLTTVPRDYHEVAYVRGLEAKLTEAADFLDRLARQLDGPLPGSADNCRAKARKLRGEK